MCEIAVLDPDRVSIEIIHQIAAKFNEEQGDGLGVLLVKNTGEKFEYTVYKSVEPHWQTLYSFLSRNLDDAWRVVIHGRNATAGNVKRKHAHPLSVNCDECQWDWVVHNGSVRNHEQIRGGLTTAGHEFNTGVDSEVIAHKVQELPSDVSELSRGSFTFSGNLHYLLFSEDGIFARSGRKYDMTDDFLMTCSRVQFNRKVDTDFGWEYSRNKYLTAEPGEEVEIETKEAPKSSTRVGHNSAYRQGSTTRGGTGIQNYTRRPDDSDGSNDTTDTHTVEYSNLSSWDSIIAVRVAPHVVKVIDTNSDDVEFVDRREEPRLFYWYVPEEEPANLDELQDLADRYGYIPPKGARESNQSSLEDFPEQRIKDAVSDEVMATIHDRIGSDIDELVEVSNEIDEAVALATDAAIQTAAGVDA